MSKYKVEMIIEVNEGHPRKWLPEWIAEQLHEGEDILEYSIREIENEFNIRVNGIWRDKYGN